ncbi:MAG: hypothetical protein U0838_13175 [Chloroflexota bacterium]
MGGDMGSRTMTLSGTVTAVDGTKLTIQTSSGNTVTVDTASATYHEQASATSSDVKAGTTVQVSVAGGGSGRWRARPARRFGRPGCIGSAGACGLGRHRVDDAVRL